MINIEKLKHLFKKAKVEDELKAVEYNEGDLCMMFSGIIYHNDYLNLCHDTCSICYDKDGSWRNLDERRSYLENKIKVGHESILQHSNVVMELMLEKTETNLSFIYKEIADGFTGVRNKHLLFDIKDEDNYVKVYIKGNILAFKNYIRYTEQDKITNLIYKGIITAMYELEPCIVYDFIQDGILVTDRFIPNYEFNVQEKYKNEIKTMYQGEYIDLIGSNENYLLAMCLDLGFSNVETLEYSTTTVFFKKIPRVISQMVTRHDNGITQLSQRYVDSTNAEFLVPADMEDDGLVTVNIDGNDKQMTVKELGNFISGFYPQLLECGFRKEQARGYLANNTNTQLYVTFTLKNLIHFLKLRTHKSAQVDIRVIADEIEIASKSIFGNWIDYNLVEPIYKVLGQQLEEKLDIDEPMGKVKQEVVK